jgi:hypothetical protein
MPIRRYQLQKVVFWACVRETVLLESSVCDRNVLVAKGTGFAVDLSVLNSG